MSEIYLIQNDKTLVKMVETSYDTEDLLQSLLADYPNLLAGDQINGKAIGNQHVLSRCLR